MTVAQHLYEGLETDEGQVGLITYMRTDSVALSGQAMGEARDMIAARFGPDYTMPKGRAVQDQDPQRPGGPRGDPADLVRALARTQLEKVLPRDEARLYRLIWQRALASQMKEKELETTSVELDADRYELRAIATRTVFDGFSAVYTEGQDDARRGAGADPAGARPRATRRPSRTSSRPSTSPSRCRATPRRP